MTGAKAVVESLLTEKVNHVFCLPGESFMSLLHELYEQPSIRVIAGRQEGGSGFMAEAYAKASGKVGVCIVTRSPGATNLSIALHTAHQDSTPLVAIIGQVKQEFLGREAFQEINTADYFSHLVKWSIEVREVARIPEIMRRAFHVAKSGRPGPVVISIPQDVLERTGLINFAQPSLGESYFPPAASASAVQAALELMLAAKNPVAIVGAGIMRSGAWHAFVQLAERLKLPVVTAFRRTDAFPNVHNNYIGHLGIQTPDYLKQAIHQADVLLALGTRLSQITTQNYTVISPDTRLIHVDISPNEINKVYPASLGIVADANEFVRSLLERVTDCGRTLENGSVTSLREQYLRFSEPRPKYSTASVDLEGVLYDLRRILPQDSIITNDVGHFYNWLYRFYSFAEQNTYFGPTSGTMGYGLPAAIGAKIANPGKITVSISGDGGFMMTLGELETSIRNNIPVIAIVVNNHSYGTIRYTQNNAYQQKYIASDLGNPDFAEYAKQIGGYGRRINRNEQFPEALESAIRSGRTAVIELMVNENHFYNTLE